MIRRFPFPGHEIEPAGEDGREPQEEAVSDLDFRLFLDFKDRIDGFYELIKSEFTASGLTATQMRTLDFLADHGNSSQQNVADELGLSRSGTSELLGQMEKKELVLRSLSSVDKRTIEVSLTEAGKAIGSRVRAEYERYCRSCMEDFSIDETRLFMDLVMRFIRRSYACEAAIRK
jgi:DNA-binding MarR family transcriptional regulator